MKTLAMLACIFWVVGCSHLSVEINERAIGPCYGSAQLYQDTMACFYDVDNDQDPDIALVYAWTGERLVLIDVMMMDEFLD